MGDNLLEEIDDKLKNWIVDAVENGLSKEGQNKLEETIQSNKSIFKIQFGSGGLANVLPMNIVVDNARKPMNVKVRKYVTEQRKLLEVYFTKLVNMDFLKHHSTSSSQSAQHLGLIDSEPMFRTTFDLRPINALTKAEYWPMLLIEAELSNFIGSMHFAYTDSCSSFGSVHLIRVLMTHAKLSHIKRQ